MTSRSGKTYYITGGLSGLGLAAARLLFSQGANVVLVDRNDTLAPEVLKEHFHDDKRAMFINVDVTDTKSVQSSFEKAVAAYGTMNGVINCAGLGSATVTYGQKGPHNMGIFDFVVKVNLYGTFYCSAFGAEAMVKSGVKEGIIINVSSVAGFEGQKGQVAYSASKGAVNGMTLPMARDLSRYGIRVMTIAPGIMETPLMMAAGEKVREGLLRNVVAPKRFGSSEEFAALCVHMIDNGYLNGEVIRLDAGLRFPNM
jgi:NAD(P)-dependent dehydrogenase (short-subunit alcohol dehydrogenase family)